LGIELIIGGTGKHRMKVGRLWGGGLGGGGHQEAVSPNFTQGLGIALRVQRLSVFIGCNKLRGQNGNITSTEEARGFMGPADIVLLSGLDVEDHKDGSCAPQWRGESFAQYRIRGEAKGEDTKERAPSIATAIVGRNAVGSDSAQGAITRAEVSTKGGQTGGRSSGGRGERDRNAGRGGNRHSREESDGVIATTIAFRNNLTELEAALAPPIVLRD